MKTNIIRIGNSRGIRLPKAWLQACNLSDIDEVEVEINKKGGLVIMRPQQQVRENWAKAFKKMAHLQDDHLLIPDNLETNWDKEEWKW